MEQPKSRWKEITLEEWAQIWGGLNPNWKQPEESKVKEERNI